MAFMTRWGVKDTKQGQDPVFDEVVNGTLVKLTPVRMDII